MEMRMCSILFVKENSSLEISQSQQYLQATNSQTIEWHCQFSYCNKPILMLCKITIYE